MANVYSNLDFYSCPTWVDLEAWETYRGRYSLASDGNPDLVQLDLELTDACNLRCLECPISADTRVSKKSVLSLESAKQILIQAREANCVALKLNYINEPLLNPRLLFEVAEFAQSIGFIDIYFTSNATLLTHALSDRLIKSMLFSRIQFSIDAIDEVTYNTIRRGGDFQLVKNNILQFIHLRSLLDSVFPLVRVSFLALPENEGQESEFFDFWSSRVDAVAIQRSVISPTSSRNSSSHFKFSRRFCPNPFRQLVVRADKSVLPCCSFWGTNLSLGTINKVDLTDFFKSSAMTALQSSFKDESISLNNSCVKCLTTCDPSQL